MSTSTRTQLSVLFILLTTLTPIFSIRPHTPASLPFGPLAFLALPVAYAYVPAVPVTDTTGLNLTDDSRLNLKWNPDAGSGGVYGASV